MLLISYAKQGHQRLLGYCNEGNLKVEVVVGFYSFKILQLNLTLRYGARGHQRTCICTRLGHLSPLDSLFVGSHYDYRNMGAIFNLDHTRSVLHRS